MSSGIIATHKLAVYNGPSIPLSFSKQAFKIVTKERNKITSVGGYRFFKVFAYPDDNDFFVYNENMDSELSFNNDEDEPNFNIGI